jgi:hypothetical protein
LTIILENQPRQNTMQLPCIPITLVGLCSLNVIIPLVLQKQLKVKRHFEQLASSHGVRIKAYRGDNGIMAKREYLQHIEDNQQTITLAGVNNHSQNGTAERNIRTISDRARTMLLYAIQHWPSVVGLDLWPFALKLAVDVHNATPGPSGLSPEEIFSRQKARPDRLLDFHTFGCPVYVLDPRLQQGNKIPKWQPVCAWRAT